MTARTRTRMALSLGLAGLALLAACTAEEGANPLGITGSDGNGTGKLSGSVTASPVPGGASASPGTPPSTAPTGKPGTGLPAQVDNSGGGATPTPGSPGQPIATPTPGVAINPGVDLSDPPSQLATLPPLPGGNGNAGTTPPTAPPVRDLDRAPSVALPLEGVYRSPLTDLPVFWGGGQRWLLDGTGMSWSGGEVGSWAAGSRAVSAPGILWRASGDRLERFDLDPEAVVPQPTAASGTWILPGNVLSLAADAQGVWAVVAGGKVWSWEASGGATRSVGVSGAREVVVSGSRALVLDGSSVVPVTRSNGQVGSAISVGAEPGPALVDAAGTAWIALKDSPTVKRIAAGQSGATTITVAAPVTCWAEAKSKVWGGMASTTQVQGLALDGTVGATISLPVAPDLAIADGAGQVWLAERVSGRLVRLIP